LLPSGFPSTPVWTWYPPAPPSPLRPHRANRPHKSHRFSRRFESRAGARRKHSEPR